MKRTLKSVNKLNKKKKLLVSITTFGFIFFGLILVAGGNIANLMSNSVTSEYYYCDTVNYTLKDNKCYGYFSYDSVLLGDVDNSGIVDQKDITVLSKFINKEEGYNFDDFRFVAADVNKDGTVNNNDLLEIQKYITGNNLNLTNSTTGIGVENLCPSDYKLNGTLCEKTDVVDAKIINYLKGDLNNNNRIDNDDIALLSQYLNNKSNLNDTQKKAADYNDDNNINDTDLELLRNALKKDSNYKCQDSTYNLKGNKCYRSFIKSPVLLGDVYIDGTINEKDITILSNYITNLYKIENNQLLAADVNKDGTVNKDDLTELSNFITNVSGANQNIGKTKVCDKNYKLIGNLCQKTDVVDAIIN